jgi:hypothetical protein
MRKDLLLTVVSLFAGLLLSTVISAQIAENNVATQTRRVMGQVLTSPSLPLIRIKFDKAFKYVGSQSFILYDRSQVEQHFFVDADDKGHIERMYMIQFEGYLPNIQATYDYPATTTVDLAGQTYIVNTEIVPDVSAVLKQDPRSDVAGASAFLEGKRYLIGGRIMYQRFVRLVDEAKRDEFILVYIEATTANASADDQRSRQEFSRRALKGFTILK